MKNEAQETAIVPATESTAELIPEPTTRLVEKFLDRCNRLCCYHCYRYNRYYCQYCCRYTV